MPKLRNIPAFLSQHTSTRRTCFLAGVAAVGLVTACAADRVAAPSDEARASISTWTSTSTSSTSISSTSTSSTSWTIASSIPMNVVGLVRTAPLAQPITRSVRLYQQGGTLSIPEVGLTVVIPRSALGDTAVTISATAFPGYAVAYDFQPHGTRFRAQLQVKQDLSGTSWASNTGRTALEGGYFASSSQVNTMTGSASVNERIGATVSGSMLMFPVSHFSGYIVSWGAK